MPKHKAADYSTAMCSICRCVFLEQRQRFKKKKTSSFPNVVAWGPWYPAMSQEKDNGLKLHATLALT